MTAGVAAIEVHGRRRFGLRARLTAAFGVGAFALSFTLSLLTYELVRSYLLGQRDSSALGQAYVNVRLLRAGLASGQTDLPRVLSTLEAGLGSVSVVERADSWYSTSLAVGRDALPADLRRQVSSGQLARQRFRLAGAPELAVGVPLAQQNVLYFEVFSLTELDRTLRALAEALAIAAALTTVAGAGVGRWASRRVLEPVSEVARAAAEIASGRLDTRLAVGPDRDLSVVTSSFNGMVEALAVRIERDARFASDVSHELRSPLTTLATSVEVLQSRRDELSPPGREALDLLVADLGRFERLVTDLLEISRFDAGAVELALEDVRVVDLVRHAINGMGASGAGGLDVAANAEDTMIRADKRRLERVLVNLVDNANSHGHGLVGVHVVRVDGTVHVSVDDAGPGVPPGHRESIFERFARGPAAGRRSGGDGVGLGLSVVAEQVRVHGGRVWVEDRPGGGARFVVELPLVES